MTNANDFAQMFQNMMGGKMFDALPANDTMQSTMEFNAKMNGIALEAAAKNTELTFGWTRDMIDSMQKLADPSIKASDYAKVSTDVVGAQMHATPELIARLSEVAKTAQTKTYELFMETGKSVQEEAVAKTRDTVQKATKKVA